MKIIKTNDGMLMFHCPGCDHKHGVNQNWKFNGDFERPTFHPSIKVQGVKPITDDEHQRLMNGEKIEPEPFICHSFVENGKIKFLGDCTHDKAGTIVELPETD